MTKSVPTSLYFGFEGETYACDVGIDDLMRYWFLLGGVDLYYSHKTEKRTYRFGTYKTEHDRLANSHL